MAVPSFRLVRGGFLDREGVGPESHTQKGSPTTLSPVVFLQQPYTYCIKENSFRSFWYLYMCILWEGNVKSISISGYRLEDPVFIYYTHFILLADFGADMLVAEDENKKKKTEAEGYFWIEIGPRPNRTHKSSSDCTITLAGDFIIFCFVFK